MTSRRPEGAEALVAPLYFVAFLLVATPTMDFVTSILPLRPDDIEWRFASVGLLSGFLLTPLLGVCLAMGVAHMASHFRFQRLIAIGNLFHSVGFGVLLLFFLLDVFQLKGAVQPEAQDAFNSAAHKALIKHAAFVVAMGWLGWKGLRISRWTAPEPRRQAASVVIGQGG